MMCGQIQHGLKTIIFICNNCHKQFVYHTDLKKKDLQPVNCCGKKLKGVKLNEGESIIINLVKSDLIFKECEYDDTTD